MSEQFKNWISNKKFEIVGKIDGKPDKSAEFVVVNNDLAKTSDIRVYLSKSSAVESIGCKTATNESLKLFNDIKSRKSLLDKFHRLIKDSAEVLEFLETITSNATIKVSRNRVRNLVNALDYGTSHQVFTHRNEFKFRAIDYSSVKVFRSESLSLKMIYEVIPHLIRGSPFRLIVEPNSALFGSYVLELLEKSGLESGIDLIIVDSKTFAKRDTKPQIAPTFVVFESADIDSSVHRLIKSYINDTIGSINVFVQQSIHKKFCERLRTRLTNSVVIGHQLDNKSDIAVKVDVNYEAIDFDNQSVGIQVFKFRTNEEMKSLIKHFVEIPFISLWAEKTSLAIEFAKSVDSTSLCFINGSVEFPVRSDVSFVDNVSDKTELDKLIKQSELESIVSSNKKWKTVSPEERLKIIRNFLLTNESKLSVNMSALDASNQQITEVKDNFGLQLIIKDFEPIGLLVLKVDELDVRSFEVILKALISGNSIVINSDKPNDNLLKLSDHLTSLGHKCLNTLNMSEIKGNSVLTVGGTAVGLYVQDIRDLSPNSIIRPNKTIRLSFGDISFAK